MRVLVALALLLPFTASVRSQPAPDCAALSRAFWATAMTVTAVPDNATAVAQFKSAVDAFYGSGCASTGHFATSERSWNLIETPPKPNPLLAEAETKGQASPHK